MAPREPVSTEPVDDATVPTDANEGVVEMSDVLLDGRYVLKRLIARGGMSVVHLAEHAPIGRLVALKILRPPSDVRDQYDFTAWFRAEARTLASFQHPNVVTLFDFGQLGPDEFFLAMEYVDGPSLSELLRKGPLDATHAVRIMRRVCSALRYSHQRGVIHRDIKPSNILLTTDEHGEEVVKVIDFGIAEVENAATTPPDDLLIGSPHCMAPEQIEGRGVRAETDIYAVGVVFYRALVGRYPFHGRTPRETLIAHMTRAIPSLRDAAPERGLPIELDAIVARCLAKHPQDRYPDMDALIADLDTFLEVDDPAMSTQSLVLGRSGEVSAAHAAMASAAHTLPTPSRAPWIVAGAALVIALAAVAALVFSPGGSEPEATAPVSASPEVLPPPVPVASPAPVAAPVPAPAQPAPVQVAPAPAPKAEPAARRPSPAPSTTRPARPAAATPRPTPPPPPPQVVSPKPEAPPQDKADVPEGYKGMPEF